MTQVDYMAGLPAFDVFPFSYFDKTFNRETEAMGHVWLTTETRIIDDECMSFQWGWDYSQRQEFEQEMAYAAFLRESNE